ncbi:caspase-14 [Tiliqua scincoides]|uniref:caspase-14 n=1 Tax=Tiliqua scincoides TaxID=71010 RepID=UPI0034631EAA
MVKEKIKAILDQLTDNDLKELRFYLRVELPTNKLEKADTTFALADLLVQHCAEKTSEVLKHALEKSNHKDLAAEVGCWETDPPAKEWKGSNNDSKPEGAVGGLDLKKHSLDCYDMSRKRVAFMVCLKQSRPGAKRDIDIMKRWFLDFNFTTPEKECIDPLGKDVIPELKAFRDKINRSNEEISCCLIILMSHGNDNGCILGRDKKEAKIEDILKLFNNKECPKLRQKPKIFIIQACRGKKNDPGVEADDEAMEPDDMTKLKLPTACDYFIVYSSQKGYVSYRDTNTGSIMITTMAQVFSERGRELHIGDLFTKVNSLMAEKEISLQDEKVKATIVMESTLTKAIYLA